MYLLVSKLGRKSLPLLLRPPFCIARSGCVQDLRDEGSFFGRASFAPYPFPSHPPSPFPFLNEQYVAPEVLELLENKKSGSSSYSGTAADAWSLGVNLYVMLCGYPPFDGDNQALLFQAIRKGQWEFDGDGWVDISPAAKDLVKGLMHQVRIIA